MDMAPDLAKPVLYLSAMGVTVKQSALHVMTAVALMDSVYI